MTKFTLIGGATALALIVCAPVAFTQGPPGGGAGIAERLRAADANGDGQITRAEAETMRAQDFTRLDRNQDGFLDAADRPADAPQGKAGRGGRSGQAMQAADTNGDGKVSRAEFLAQPYRLFDRIDANRDNVVTQAELDQARQAMGQRRQPS